MTNIRQGQVNSDSNLDRRWERNCGPGKDRPEQESNISDLVAQIMWPLDAQDRY